MSNRCFKQWILPGLSLILALSFSSNNLLGDELKLSGHIKQQITHDQFSRFSAMHRVGPVASWVESTDLRLNLDGSQAGWDYSLQGESLTYAGETLRSQNRSPEVNFSWIGSTELPGDRHRLFRLSKSVVENLDTESVVRLDRMNIGYSTDRLVIRLGRQAVSWGDGMAFQVFDVLNPFSPVAVEKDYKTGDDLAYLQYLFDATSEVQLIVVPRRDPVTSELTSDQSSFAAKVRKQILGSDCELVFAQHYSEGLVGVGVLHEIGEAMWRSNVTLSEQDNSDSALSFLVNLDRSFSMLDKNTYGFIEYFHSDFGFSANRYSISHGNRLPNRDLLDRLSRGEMFTLGRDYLALGGRVEMTPLLNLHQTILWNLGDGSAYSQLKAVYDIKSDIVILAGLNLPLGGLGTEYGGVKLAETTYASPPLQVFVRASLYF